MKDNFENKQMAQNFVLLHFRPPRVLVRCNGSLVLAVGVYLYGTAFQQLSQHMPCERRSCVAVQQRAVWRAF